MSSGDIKGSGRIIQLIESRLIHCLLRTSSCWLLYWRLVTWLTTMLWSGCGLGFEDGTPSTNYFFMYSFSFRRAWISSSFFLFMTTIFLYRDISNNIYSASNIFSLVVFLVDTICFVLLLILSAQQWVPIVLVQKGTERTSTCWFVLRSVSSCFSSYWTD